jgi:cellulose synthase (UDP-forming)
MTTPGTIPRARKHQFGAERRVQPLPAIHAKPSERKLIAGRLAIIATVVFWMLYVVTTIIRQFIEYGSESFRFTIEAVSYLVVVTFLSLSALLYLVARQGALLRFAAHERVPRADLDSHFSDHHGAATVLVPSYSEEPDIVRATLWSAALQEYPNLRVVLLLDDPPHPTDPHTIERLETSRAITARIQSELAAPAERFTSARLLFALDAENGQVSSSSVRVLAEHYGWAVTWLQEMAAAEKIDDHVEFFVSQVILGLATELQHVERALHTAADEGAVLDPERISQLYDRLAWTFSARLSTFERKLYSSVSHEANKAMNLNAYIGLMGGNYRTEVLSTGTVLRKVNDGERWDLSVPDSTYVLTLDADSILLREYCLRLVYMLEQPGNERIAVTQTPYSSFRGAPTRIERIAGATTDIQHILHQGMTYHNATFWVGANAVIRKSALEDIVEEEMVGGFPVRRYVQDRTVIEDTESSVDLGSHGWTLANYPERLSYSATPPDFGSLIVQRRRWANGGLLIMPKLIRQIRDRRARGERVYWGEIALRVNYMGSIAWASLGLIFLLAYPYDGRLLSPLLLLAAAPYFLAMASDLKYTGYKYSDVFRIYGFNLLLLPVNIAGVLKSIEQAITGRKIPFARTPKVRDRTVAPLLYVVAPYVIVAFSIFTFWRDFSAQNWGNATFAAVNALLTLGAIVATIGLRASLVDIWLGLTNWMWVDATPKKKSAATVPAVADSPAADTGLLDWQTQLHNGDVAAHIVRPSERAQWHPAARHRDKADK